jgi:hypothetical protein
MRYLAIILIVLSFISCQKDYKCICYSSYNNQDTIVDQIKTTKLGSKGYKKTCINKENAYSYNCRLQ